MFLEILSYVLMGILLLSAVFLVVSVLLQKTKEDGLSGAITGGADTFYGKDGSSHTDVILKKWTKIVGVIFAVCVLAVYIIQPDYDKTAALDSWKTVSQFGSLLK